MFPAPFYLAFLLTGFSPSNLYAGIEELTLLISPDGKKHVVLAGDIHDRMPGSQTKRLAQSLANCQKQDPRTFEVHIEKPSALFVPADSEELTIALPRAIKGKKIPQVSCHNAEIRNIGLLAAWLFTIKYPDEVNSNSQLDSAGRECIVGGATFSDLEKEFNEHHTSLTSYAFKLPEHLKACFLQRLSIAAQKLTDFQALIKPHVDPTNCIFPTAINLMLFEENKIEGGIRSQVEDAIYLSFAHLLELNMVRMLYTSKAPKLLFLAGELHTREVRDLLKIAQWKDVQKEQQSIDVAAINFQALENIKAAREE